MKPRDAEESPVVVNRRITEQFLSADPLAYKPAGTDITRHFKEGYGWGNSLFYATVSLWTTALDNARQFGDKELEKRLLEKFEPVLAKSNDVLRAQYHVDYNVVGVLPLAVARLTGDARAREIGLSLADYQWSEPRKDTPAMNGNPSFEEAMRLWKDGYSGETRLWIDDMYMINLLQTEAYRLTGERKYLDRAAKEMCLYLDRLQLENGLFNHAPDVPFVWGRGAGWMAAGMPLVLKCLPTDHPRRAKILAGYRKMMARLLACQRSDGLWGQLADDPTTWGETSGSAMFAYGLAEGLVQGWLDRDAAEPAVRRAWRALCGRLDEHGNVSGVCIGTNKKNDRPYYLDRPRLNGDPHGQAPMLWLAGALGRLETVRKMKTPMTSRHFERRVDPVSGIVSYALSGGERVNCQSLYFTAKSMTDDGRFLVFDRSENERFNPNQSTFSRRKAVVDFLKDEIFVLPGLCPYGEVPFVEPKEDYLVTADERGFVKFDLRDPATPIRLCDFPAELLKLGKPRYFFTHLTLTPDRRKAFLDACLVAPGATNYVQGLVELATGRFEEWGRTDFRCNHGQLNPVRDDLALCAWEECWLGKGQERWRELGYCPRLWLMAPGGSQTLIRPIGDGNATHEIWDDDGGGFTWCRPGVCHYDLATGKAETWCPDERAIHDRVTRDKRYVVYDRYDREWWRGCRWAVSFYDRKTKRTIDVYSMRQALNPRERPSRLHPDPHPQFVCGERYVVSTANNAAGNMELYVTPVEQLKSATATGAAGEKDEDRSALKNDWENPAVNSVNRLPARTYAMPLKDVASALTDAIEPETPYKISLNGTWRLSWTGDPALRAKDFWRTDFDDSRWFDVAVPGCVELQGFGSPGYVNVLYPHADASHPTNAAFAAILDRDTGGRDYNPVSSYRRRFAVPESWKGRRVILRFDGVYSAYYVWVNGKKVGYAEDSKLPSEFDVTPYLNPVGESDNLLAVEVYRWCDGSYLEDQDMFRFSGIFRDVSLWSMPQDGIWDFSVRTTPVDGEYAKWRLEVSAESGVEMSLYDDRRRKVADLRRVAESASPDAAALGAPACTYAATLTAQAWSAEEPRLYALVLKKGGDVRMKRVGFKEQKIVGNAFLVNGKPVKFKGVNRHEASPERGRSVTLDEMVRDVTLMKRYNVNAVRTCHYPDHRLWYDLCDRYGIYVIAEANVEGHEPGYGEKGFGRFPEWTHSIVERNARQALFYRNNPSVTMWSMGNETGHGDGFRAAIAAVKKLDPTRPVHWQVGCQDADVDGWMYPTVDWLDLRGRLGDSLPGGEKAHHDEYGTYTHQKAGKCFFLCEYAHAMGTALGNFQEYWDVYYRYDSLCGGCVWDWVDQAIWKTTDRIDPKTGRAERYLAYGGDWDEYPNDGPFCCNGLIGPDREPTSKLREVAHVHRNLVVTRKESGFELWNRHLFTRADAFDATWALRADGDVVASGAFKTPPVAPLARGALVVPALDAAIAEARKDVPDAELFAEFAFATTRDERWAKKGLIVARDQIAIRANAFRQASLEAIKPDVVEDAQTVTVQAGGTKAVFSRRTGTLSSLEMDGRVILRDAAEGLVAGPRLTCLRAFTDNDRWMRDGDDFSEDRKVGSCYSRGLTQLRHHARPIVVSNGVVKTSVAVTGSKSAGFEHEADWSFGPDGSISVVNRVVPHGTMPPCLPRLGLSLVLDPALERMEWYGRGPQENYVDRCTSAFFGRWRSTVTEQYEGAVRPQDCGYKTGVRWVSFADGLGRGVRFEASEPLFVQALHYAREDLEFARHRNGMSRFRAPLEPRPEVMLNLDVRQTGLGGASCGPRPLEKYRFPIAPTTWTLRMRALNP